MASLFLLQYEHVPEKYDEMYNKITCQGARVLALGYKKLGEMAAKDVRVICCLNTFVCQRILKILLLGSKEEQLELLPECY